MVAGCILPSVTQKGPRHTVDHLKESTYLIQYVSLSLSTNIYTGAFYSHIIPILGTWKSYKNYHFYHRSPVKTNEKREEDGYSFLTVSHTKS